MSRRGWGDARGIFLGRGQIPWQSMGFGLRGCIFCSSGKFLRSVGYEGGGQQPITQQSIGDHPMTTTFELLEPRRLFAGVPAGNVFVQTNIVSDGFVTAAHTDVDLKNPWGVSFLPSGPFWISDNGTSKTTVYDSTGSKALSVNIPRWRAGIGADRAGAESVLQRL